MKAETFTLDDWRVEVDDHDEPVLAGTVNGRPMRTALVTCIDLTAWKAEIVDGSVVALGRAPENFDICDPLALPAAAQQRRRERIAEAYVRIARGEPPTPAELAAAPVLEAWSIVEVRGYKALSGVVRGHPRRRSGALIRTSPLLWLSHDGTCARTCDRWYRLAASLDEMVASDRD